MYHVGENDEGVTSFAHSILSIINWKLRTSWVAAVNNSEVLICAITRIAKETITDFEAAWLSVLAKLLYFNFRIARHTRCWANWITVAGVSVCSSIICAQYFHFLSWWTSDSEMPSFASHFLIFICKRWTYDYYMGILGRGIFLSVRLQIEEDNFTLICSGHWLSIRLASMFTLRMVHKQAEMVVNQCLNLWRETCIGVAIEGYGMTIAIAQRLLFYGYRGTRWFQAGLWIVEKLSSFLRFSCD